MKERFEALHHTAQQKILDKHRYSEVEDNDWSEFIQEDFKEDMEKFGIRVDEIYFSGFCCQGDGAMFEGRIDNWPKFLEHVNAPECFNHEGIYDNMSFKVGHSGRYYHSNSTSYETSMELDNYHPKYTLRWHAMQALIDECEAHIEAFREQCEECFKEHMDDLYKALEEQHDYLTSDEYVLERLIETDQMEDELKEYEDEDETV